MGRLIPPHNPPNSPGRVYGTPEKKSGFPRQSTSVPGPIELPTCGMNITPAEAGVLAEAVRRRVGFLVTLRERMERTGRTGDPAFRLVREAEDALRNLWAEWHYRACGINRPAESEDCVDRLPVSGTNLGTTGTPPRPPRA
jgi:hypothetical protein